MQAMVLVLLFPKVNGFCLQLFFHILCSSSDGRVDLLFYYIIVWSKKIYFDYAFHNW